jgi:ferredoxin
MLGMAGLLTACSSHGGDDCGGIEDLVSCVTITNIQPTATAGGDTSDVDVIQDDCDPGPAVDPEVFTKHDARITFVNQTHPSASGSLDVTLERVRITYAVNSCPPAATCPPLPAIDEAISITIPEDSEAEETFDLVPISTKNRFNNLGGSADEFPSYTANYAFTARTQFFQDTFTIRGSVNFVLGHFLVCQ